MTIRLEDLLSPPNPSMTDTSAKQSYTLSEARELVDPIDISEMIPEHAPPIDISGVAPGTPIATIPEPEPEIIPIPEYILNDPQIVGFPNEEYQQAIYDYVAKGFLPISGDVSILDIGCGRGDMAVHFAKSFPALKISFIGVDLNKVFIDAGNVKHSHGNPENLYGFGIYDGDYSTVDITVNFTTIVGSLNLKYDNTSDDKWTTLANMLEYALKHATVAVKVILLNHAEDEQYIQYPIDETVKLINKFGLPFNVDASEFDTLYSVTIFVKSVNH